jgi:hypothetical protein
MMAETVLVAVKVLDQVLALARRAVEQARDHLARDGIDGPAHGNGARAADIGKGDDNEGHAASPGLGINVLAYRFRGFPGLDRSQDKLPVTHALQEVE